MKARNSQGVVLISQRHEGVGEVRSQKWQLQDSKNRLLARAARNGASVFAWACRAATATERSIGRIGQVLQEPESPRRGQRRSSFSEVAAL